MMKCPASHGYTLHLLVRRIKIKREKVRKRVCDCTYSALAMMLGKERCGGYQKVSTRFCRSSPLQLFDASLMLNLQQNILINASSKKKIPLLI